MQRKSIRVLITCLLLLGSITFNSCMQIFMLKMGMRSPHIMNENRHARYLKEFDAPKESAYLLDSNYLYFLDINDTTQFRVEKKNHYQPIQAIYYGHEQFQEAWFINCYAPGYPKLNWNIDNNFASFPPTSAAPLDTLVSFDRLIKHATAYKNHEKSKVGKDQPYTVVFIWNRFMIRESRSLHQQIKENLKMCKEPYRIIYINNDNIFVDADMEKSK